MASSPPPLPPLPKKTPGPGRTSGAHRGYTATPSGPPGGSPVPTPAPGAPTPVTITEIRETQRPNISTSGGGPTSTTPIWVMGVILIIVANYTNGKWKSILSSLWNGASNSSLTGDLLTVAGEVMFIGILALIGSISTSSRSLMIALIVGIFLVWAMFNLNTLSKILNAVAPKG